MVKCSQPNCRVGVTGVCLEGHKQGCSHILPQTSNDDEKDPDLSLELTISEEIGEPFRFHSGEKLTVSEASRIMNHVPVKIVLCAGTQFGGKSTFLARLGEMFRDGSFRDFRFAASKTLCAFERVSWPATISSGVSRPDTPRSRHAERDTFFHVRVRPTGGVTCMDVLISDLPGEDFPTMLASRQFCLEQRALARADCLVLFIDCRCLVHNAKRHSERDNALQFLSQVQKTLRNPRALPIHIVFSRLDYVLRDDNRKTHEEFCSGIEMEIKQRFEKSFGPIFFSRVAARPEGMKPTDAEIQLIFGSWLKSPISARVPIFRNPAPKRDFCAFGLL